MEWSTGLDEDAADSSETLEERSMSNNRKSGAFVSFSLLLSSSLILLLGQANNYMYYYCSLIVITVFLCTLRVHLTSVRGANTKSSQVTTRHASVNIVSTTPKKISEQAKSSFSFRYYCKRQHCRGRRSGTTSSSSTCSVDDIEREGGGAPFSLLSSPFSSSVNFPARKSPLVVSGGAVLNASRPSQRLTAAAAATVVAASREQPETESSFYLTFSGQSTSDCDCDSYLHNILLLTNTRNNTVTKTKSSCCTNKDNNNRHHFFRKTGHRPECSASGGANNSRESLLEKRRIDEGEEREKEGGVGVFITPPVTPGASSQSRSQSRGKEKRQEGESLHLHASQSTADTILRNMMKTCALFLVHDDLQLKNDNKNNRITIMMAMMTQRMFLSSSLST